MIQTLPEAHLKQTPKDALTTSSEYLQQVLSDDVAGRERDWAAGVARALGQVEREVRRHQATAQSTDGPLAALDQTRPTLFRQWSILCLHYRDLQKRVQRLRGEARQAAEAFQPRGETLEAAATPASHMPVGGVIPVFGAIRQEAEEVLADLRR